MEKPTTPPSSASSVQIHQESVPTSPTLSSTRKMSLSTAPTTTATTAKPTWLLSNLADVEERMKMLAFNSNSKSTKTPQDQDTGDTFAERAEAYYKTRPQLLSLLQDLYNSYLTLSDRYIQTIAKTTSLSQSQIFHPPRRQSSQTSTFEYYDYYDQQDQYETSQNDSDVESSLSYQQFPTSLLAQDDDDDTTMVSSFDAIVAEIVIKNVECDILLHEVNASERQQNESSRKIELQKSLLEVLESERLILLNENAKLGYRVGALMEENKALASESLFMRRKAGELARHLLQMREDRRVSMLSRKIEDLQGQIYGLEKRNKEYYQQLVNNDHSQLGSLEEEKNSSNNKKKTRGRSSNEVDLHVCFQIGKMKRRGGTGTRTGTKGTGTDKKGSSWWGKVKNIDLFLCGLNPTSTA
ncbi:kinase-interacting family protein [Rosa rugosa]|uniref:kinase-interacting family protein n=1 Tax=Rosa rugosa TaxID=74645 RepID=UPI002B400CCD|nr:kinase-interacting family protein [Rosa rugosa]XP_062026791.1 kinase-interacting family protein [Rosa rugosa]